MIAAARQEIAHIYRQTPDLATSRLIVTEEWDVGLSLAEIRAVAQRCQPNDYEFDIENSVMEENAEVTRIFFVCRLSDYNVVFQRYIINRRPNKEKYSSILVCAANSCGNYRDLSFSIG